MNQQEQAEWDKIVINSDTFKKSPQEKIDLLNAKKKHKQFVRENPSYSGVR